MVNFKRMQSPSFLNTYVMCVLFDVPQCSKIVLHMMGLSMYMFKSEGNN